MAPRTLFVSSISSFHISANRCKITPFLGAVAQACMALKTKGFRNQGQLNRHYQEHGGDFGASNPTDYESMADAFLGGSKPSGTKECTRMGGDILRYDPLTEAFGILGADGVIRSFYKPVPCVTLPASVRYAVRMAGRCHGEASNLVYFQQECQRQWP